MSWQTLMKNAVTGNDEFLARIASSPEECAAYRRILDAFPMSVPEYYLSLVNFDDPNDPIRKMCIPSSAEANMAGSLDTSGETENTVIPGLQHKYAQTAMLLSTHNCAMYCRHCFRKRLVGLPGDEAQGHLDELVSYIASHREISNVLISGGDAFMNSNALIEKFLAAFCDIAHLDFIRFGTRTPVVLPQRVYEDNELLDILQKYSAKKKILIVTQFNHPRELTPEAQRAVNALRERGVEVKNQCALLRGVNDSSETLAELMRGLSRFGVAAYYIFQCRPVRGVGGQFQVPLSEAYGIVEKAKAALCGPTKGFRYVMSHVTGKIEIIGQASNGEMIFKYHQAKYPEDFGRVFTMKVENNQAWLGDIPR